MKSTPNLVERPPVVTVLGHVDHGKSTLLDYIRKANTVSKEAGGITQHVAAYEVAREKNGDFKRITFIDTPGHSAFAAIRSRGASVADIAILVVAADDGVKAQTLEALASIRGAKTPFIVAINKIDKPNADLSRTQATLLENHVFLEQLGGDVPWVAISAKTGAGIEELLDLILLVAEVQELKGDTNAPASGYVIEAHRDKKRGIAATLIIKNGAMRTGQFIRAGAGISPVRIMESHLGVPLQEATFSTPIRLIGFDELPDVGAEFHTHESKRDAEETRSSDPTLQKSLANSVENDDPNIFFLPIIIRADTTGSLEAIVVELKKIGDATRKVRIVQSGIGSVSEDDIKTAIAAGIAPASVLGFHVGTDQTASAFALERGVHVEFFDIIYKLTERLNELLLESAPKRVVEEILGRAKVLKFFSSKRDEHVFGAEILEGALKKGGAVRITRRGEVVGRGEIVGLQSNKQNVEKVETEGQFGAVLASDHTPSQGDVIEYVVTRTE